MPWPTPRFHATGHIVLDALTGLSWLRDANFAEFPRTWEEAHEMVAGLNQDRHAGHCDWRLPNCRELRSLVSYQARRPALPAGHPFRNVFPSWYWSSTTAAVNGSYAWYVNLDGGRMFYGNKADSYMVWPVRGAPDAASRLIATPTRIADRTSMIGAPLSHPRFIHHTQGIEDRLTGLTWTTGATASAPCRWQDALDRAREMHARRHLGASGWRLPNINELESLVDFRHARPALTPGHPFSYVPEAVWASTTSLYEPDWAWALYLHKGACGVGQKAFPHYDAWFVRG